MLKYRIILLITVASILVIGLICVCAYHHFATKDLLRAIEAEDVLNVEQLLKEGADPNKLRVPPSKFWSFVEYSPDLPLSIACETGNLEIVELLISYGANAEPSDEAGFTPLEATLFYFQPDDPEIVALLLENGAKTEDLQNGKAVISAARMKPCVYDKTKANGTVFSSGYDESTAIGITKIVDMLLAENDIDSETGVNLLKASIQQENLYLTQYLLTKGCSPTTPDSSGKTPHDYAKEINNTDLLHILCSTEDGVPSSS